MKQIITIEIPEGKAVTKVTYPDGNISISFRDKEPIRSKSWEDFCKKYPNVLQEYRIHTGTVQEIRGVTRYCFGDFLATKEDAEGILALIQLTRLHDEWVEGSDYKKLQTKAYIYITSSSFSPFISVGVEHHLLDFPNSKMATEFLCCFEDLILKAKKFL